MKRFLILAGSFLCVAAPAQAEPPPRLTCFGHCRVHGKRGTCVVTINGVRQRARIVFRVRQRGAYVYDHATVTMSPR
jgi:hypothetical protein